MQTLLQDFRYALRLLAKSPGFATVAILTLALGIGANTAIFSLIDAVILRSLPVKDAGRLVLFQWRGIWPPNSSQTGGDAQLSFSYPAFRAMLRANVLESTFAFVPLGFSDENAAVSLGGEPTLANGWMVSGDFFAGLGVQPILGRALSEADENPAAPRVAVISYDYWTRRFARAPAAIGNSLPLNGVPFTIVGVAPRGFYGVQLGEKPDLWIPFDDLPNLRPWSMAPFGSSSVFTASGWMCLNIMGRLKASMTEQQAQAALDLAFQRFVAEELHPPKDSKSTTLALVPAAQGLNYLRQAEAQSLYVLMTLVGMVLLIACASLAALLLARASTRGREISVRRAVGASRWRLIRQLLTESMLLAASGAALGLLLARWGSRVLLSLIAEGGPGMNLDVRADSTVLLFTLGVCVATGLLFGAAPAIISSRVDIADAMKKGTSGLVRDRRGHKLGKALVIAQVAISLMLMIGAGLFVRTLVGLESKNFGFNQRDLLLFGLDAAHAGYKGDAAVRFYQQLLDRIEALPGVTAATFNINRPFSGGSNNTNISIEGAPRGVGSPALRWDAVGPDFFRTMQIPILLGRPIAREDSANSPRVAVVDETFAHKYFPHSSPIGHRFALGNNGGVFKPGDGFEIVGVAKNAEYNDVNGYQDAKAYMPFSQFGSIDFGSNFEVRSVGDPTAVLSEIRAAVREVSSAMPLTDVKTQEEATADALVQQRLFARISAFFGFLALLLAIIGLYGTLAYAVSRRIQEIGIRMALGAQRSVVLRTVLAQGLVLVAIGLAIGVAGALGLTRYIASELYGVTPTDATTFALVPLLLLATASAACYIPARRAMRVDPMVALRHE